MKKIKTFAEFAKENQQKKKSIFSPLNNEIFAQNTKFASKRKIAERTNKIEDSLPRRKKNTLPFSTPFFPEKTKGKIHFVCQTKANWDFLSKFLISFSSLKRK